MPRPALAFCRIAALSACAWGCGSSPAPAADAELPVYLADRGPGLATSLFGTYVEPGQWLVYPFVEYENSSAFEYKPSEVGFVGNQDYLGHLVTQEFDLYTAYGITDRLMVELEGQLDTSATLDRAPDDISGVPASLKESGVGEIEGQVRYRWQAENERRPELFSFMEVVFPLQKDKHLIGAQDWGGAIGFGAIKGYSWGTLTARASIAYDDGVFEPGEYALEYLKRISPRWRCVAALEGESDELSLIGEAQYFFTRHAYLKLNSGFGLTKKTPDFAPEIGIMMTIGP
ncbi:MAG TPA: hypothetical protein VE046_09530 [Steroidobacteraceae bacterium]|nr:hypothetical protein [Steroidobacteraceae bacterium]